MALEPISLFKDLAIADAFQENGYVKIPFTSDLQLLRLKQLFKNYFGEEDVFKNFFYSIQALTPDQCLVLKNAISQILEPSLNNTFVNYKTIADSFLAKPKNLESMWLHQDWSYAFEQDTFLQLCGFHLSIHTQVTVLFFTLNKAIVFFRTTAPETIPHHALK